MYIFRYIAVVETIYGIVLLLYFIEVWDMEH